MFGALPFVISGDIPNHIDACFEGYTTTDYHVWPMLATTMSLVLVMFISAMAGSTAGGIKVLRIVIELKGNYINSCPRVWNGWTVFRFAADKQDW